MMRSFSCFIHDQVIFTITYFHSHRYVIFQSLSGRVIFKGIVGGIIEYFSIKRITKWMGSTSRSNFEPVANWIKNASVVQKNGTVIINKGPIWRNLKFRKKVANSLLCTYFSRSLTWTLQIRSTTSLLCQNNRVELCFGLRGYYTEQYMRKLFVLFHR